MFGAASPFFGGFDFFADGVVGEGYDWTTLIFQTVFCATAATIVSGSMAERTKFICILHLLDGYLCGHLPGFRSLDLGRRLARRAWLP